MKIPEPENTIAALIDKAHEARAEGPRPHLGASLIGHPCDRWLWISFRHAVIEKFPGRILRLFRRGQNEEAIIVQDLRAIGVDIKSTGANQARVDFGKHFSGSIDGVITGGIPGKEKSKAIIEEKTHGDKSFKALVKDGVEKSKPMHWAQCQIYALGKGLERALYFAINKNTDEIYTEWIHLDKPAAERLVARAHRITMSERMPEGISQDGSWYECKYCPAWDFCFGSKLTKEVNCRTCAHVTPLENSTWRCERYAAEPIPFEHQRTGCESHVLNPQLVPWELGESTNPHEAVYIIDGKPVRNGEPDAYCFSSKEMLANPAVCANPEKEIQALREKLGARVVG